MGTLIFTCPLTGRCVQGLLPEDASEEDENTTYRTIQCLACGQVHLINPATGRVLRPSED